MIFTRPTAFVADQIRGTVARPRRVSGTFLMRLAILLLTLLAVGVYTANRILQPTSLQGVVNAQLITLRAPIDGVVARGGAAIGQTVAPGAELFAVRDPRVDQHRERDLQTRAAGAGERVAALGRSVAEHERMETELIRRTADYAAAEAARLAATIGGQETTIENARQALNFTRQRETLLQARVTAGTAVEQRLEDAVRARLAAQTVLDRLLTERQGNAAALEAARRSIFVQNGFGGAAYAQQKADEVRIRLLDLRYQQALAAADATGLRQELDTETAHTDALREVSVPAASGGVVTAVHAAPGAIVMRGNPLADVMDCRALYIEATVSTGWFATPRPGDRVRVTLYGADGSVDGRIRTLRDPSMADPARGTAPAERDSRGTLTAIIDIDGGAAAAGQDGVCPVGRPASVRFR